MIVSESDARKVIEKAYGLEFGYVIGSGVSIGVRPVYEVSIGLPILAWGRARKGKDAPVRIGRMRPDSSIDWDWVPPDVPEPRDLNMNGVRVRALPDGTILIPLPRILWRVCPLAGDCRCETCKGEAGPGYWDALAVHPSQRYAWNVHAPELQANK